MNSRHNTRGRSLQVPSHMIRWRRLVKARDWGSPLASGVDGQGHPSHVMGGRSYRDPRGGQR